MERKFIENFANRVPSLLAKNFKRETVTGEKHARRNGATDGNRGRKLKLS